MAVEELGLLPAGRIARLRPMDAVTAAAVSEILAEMAPWSRLGSSPKALAQSMIPAHGSNVRSWCLTVDGETAGVVVVYDGWLMGPYLRRLAVLPGYQRLGLAQAVLAWWEAGARRAGSRNLWLCVSDFNTPAQALYEGAGFREAAVLNDLVADGLDEILMRKQLKSAPTP